MADVYYRVSGRPTATFTSCGPGSANLPISLGNAFLDSVPFLAVTGNVPTSQFNRGAFQETYRHYQADFPSTVRAYCKRVFQPTTAAQLPVAVRQAWKTMVTGRPGPVVLDVPFDMFNEPIPEETPRPEDWNSNISCRCGADPQGVAKAADMLMAAQRPVMLVGQGVRYGRATGELRALAEKLRIPVAMSASGIGAIDAVHPLALGLVARNGPYQANHAARQADVLLALGVRFDDRTSSSWIPGYSFTIPPTKLIHVDIDPEEIARNYPVALGLMADVRTFLRQLLAEIDARIVRGQMPAERGAWLPKLAAALVELCRANELSGVHVNFCLDDERAALEAAGFLPRLGFQYHWSNTGFASFEAYLASLRSKRRNQVRRERRGVAEQGVRTEVLRGDAIPDALFEPLFRCYTATVDAHVYGRRYLNRRFFELIAERFRHRLCCVVARRGEEVVGSTLNVVKGDAFYGRYWGGLEAIRYLHFDVCYYAAIEHCIEAGIQRFEPGAGGDYKFLRGFDATATRSLHHLEDPRLAHAIARFLEAERADAGQVIEHLGRHSARKSAPP
jgi:hypothetical protein